MAGVDQGVVHLQIQAKKSFRNRGLKVGGISPVCTTRVPLWVLCKLVWAVWYFLFTKHNQQPLPLWGFCKLVWTVWYFLFTKHKKQPLALRVLCKLVWTVWCFLFTKHNQNKNHLNAPQKWHRLFSIFMSKFGIYMKKLWAINNMYQLQNKKSWYLRHVEGYILVQLHSHLYFKYIHNLNMCRGNERKDVCVCVCAVSYTHLRAHETG